jgi:hypothetical protein
MSRRWGIWLLFCNALYAYRVVYLFRNSSDGFSLELRSYQLRTNFIQVDANVPQFEKAY